MTPIVCFIRFFVIASLSLFYGYAHSGDQEFIAPEEGEARLCTFSGTIEPEDVAQLRENVLRGCHTLLVSSLGGDVDTALALGRIAREAAMAVSVVRGEKCASACVFLYAGGVMRAPYGQVWIHRPYLENSSASFSETQQRFADLGQRVKIYLREVNVNEGLFDRMMTIPPEKAQAVSLEEMDTLGLGFVDQVHSEFLENKRAAKAGMTKREFLRKKERTAQYCGALVGEAILEREVELRQRCWQQRFPEFMPK